MRHALSIDVEDWPQSVFDHALPVTERFRVGMDRALELLDRAGVRATLFVLGLLARKYPGWLRRVHEAGHEVQIHGFDHTEVHRLGREAFRQDLLRAKGAVEDAIGAAVCAYRAPRFSITAGNLWALDVLADEGFEYDSSIFPMALRGYGIPGWPARIHRLKTATGRELFEVPVATLSWLGRRWPIGGGGYFRILPDRIIRWGLARLERLDIPAVIYCHPHEFDPQAFDQLDFTVPMPTRLHQGLGRSGFERKMSNLLDEFRFGPIRNLLPARPVTAPMEARDGVGPQTPGGCYGQEAG
ncbi:MAG: polysaccharide deacetylase family protein [Phycisphaerae bacterium]